MGFDIDIFIMAQGQATRWDIIETPKHLLPIGKDKLPILQRTLNMLPQKPYLVTFPEIYQFLTTDKFTPITFENPGTLLHGIWQCAEHTNFTPTNTLFLLGDVVFSKAMMNKILDYTYETPRLFGRIGQNEVTGKEASELFALSIPEFYYTEFFRRIKILWTASEMQDRKCRLWDLHRNYHYEVQTIPDDYTDDIDDYRGYLQFYDKLNQAVIDDE